MLIDHAASHKNEHDYFFQGQGEPKIQYALGQALHHNINLCAPKHGFYISGKTDEFFNRRLASRMSHRRAPGSGLGGALH